jgi:hypothetical protein
MQIPAKLLALVSLYFLIVSMHSYALVSHKVPQSMDEIYNFSSLGAIFEPTQPMQSLFDQQTLWPLFDNKSLSVEVTAVFTTSGRVDFLDKTLKSFFRFNTYPLKKIIVIHDGRLTKGITQMMTLYRNITFVVTGRNIGQLAAIDHAYQMIATPYFFHSEDDWEFLLPGFVEFGLHVLQHDTKVAGLLMRPFFDP